MHEGGWQIVCAQEPLAQSLDAAQVRPSLQRAHDGPPQSTSVSSPSFTPSVQPAISL
jgi:hypothetical protein